MPEAKLTGGLVNYYLVKVEHPQRAEQPAYQAECEDIIRALNMTFDEGCEFKAIWRTAAARMGNGKPGQKAIYDAEKRVHYAQASLRGLRTAQANTLHSVDLTDSEAAGMWWWWSGTESWHGNPTDLVDVRLRDNTILNRERADNLRWNHAGIDGDIIAYRLRSNS